VRQVREVVSLLHLNQIIDGRSVENAAGRGGVIVLVLDGSAL
jgi:hypothetical protein